MALAGRIHVPLAVVGLHDDGLRAGQLFTGEGRSLLAVFFDFAGAFGGVHGQETGLEHAGFADLLIHMEMHRVAVDEGLDGGLGLHGFAAPVKGKLGDVINGLRLLGLYPRQESTGEQDGEKQGDERRTLLHACLPGAYQMANSHSSMASAKASSIMASTLAAALDRQVVSRVPTWLRASEEPLKAGEV